VTFSHLLAEREERVRLRSRWPVHDVAVQYLSETALQELWTRIDREVRARYHEFCPPIPGASEVLSQLSSTFRLGLIANQPRECRALLRQLGWIDHFQCILLSEEQGLWKPDPRLFQRALDQARVRASECVMVGDRIDTDLAPAVALGLQTVWVRWHDRTAKGWIPSDAHEILYKESLWRTGNRDDADATALGVTQVVDAIRDLPAHLGSGSQSPCTSPNDWLT
jgi:HAD superfamily hydrolase (TIGR01549 family)